MERERLHLNKLEDKLEDKLETYWDRLRQEAAAYWPYVLDRCDQVVSRIPPRPSFGDIKQAAYEIGDVVKSFPAGRLLQKILLSIDEDREPVPLDDLKNRLRELIEQEKRRRQEAGEPAEVPARAAEAATADATDAEG